MIKSAASLLLFLGIASLASGCSSRLYEPKEPVIIEHEDGYVEALPPAECPDWRNHHLPNYGNTVLSNFGCAHARNIAAMVEDPADLAGEYRSTVSPDADRAVGVIGGYKTSAQPVADDAQGGGEPAGGGS